MKDPYKPKYHWLINNRKCGGKQKGLRLKKQNLIFTKNLPQILKKLTKDL